MKNNLIISTLLLIIFSFNIVAAEPTAAQKKIMESLPPDQRDALIEKMDDAESLAKEIEESFDQDKETLIERPELSLRELDADEICKECIYGYEMFRFSPTTFAPVEYVPVPSEYMIGPGDKLHIEYFGSEEIEKEVFIMRDGTLNLPLIGSISVNGLSFFELKSLIEDKVTKNLLGTRTSVSIKRLASISVYILGEAYKPGTYNLSALSSITNALFLSGGVNKNGSLRNIQLKRNGKTISNYDFYDFLLKGKTEAEVRLQEGDIIYIPFIEDKVKIGGSFKRPFIYEFLKGETIEDAINLAGGFKSGTILAPNIELSSIDPSLNERKLTLLDRTDLSYRKIRLNDGDVINISEFSGLEPITIELKGQVNNPGVYSIQKGERILNIIERAGGYTEESFTEGAVFLRKHVADQQKEGFKRNADALESTLINLISNGSVGSISQYTFAPIMRLIEKLRTTEPAGRQVVDVDYLSLKSDPLNNFIVRDGDFLFIPKRPDSVTVVGEVLNSSTLRYRPSYSLSRYLDSAGGLTDEADNNKVFTILPNGQASVVKNGFFNKRANILPGSTIVVPRDSRPLDAVALTKIITPVLADLATSAAAIAAISD